MHTCECILGISSACCSINLNADVFEQTFATSHCDVFTCEFDVTTLLFASLTEPLLIVFGINCKFDDGIEFNDCKLDEIKPGGGSTPSAISMARCKRAFLSQSSIEYSSENLNKEKRKISN